MVCANYPFLFFLPYSHTLDTKGYQKDQLLPLIPKANKDPNAYFLWDFLYFSQYSYFFPPFFLFYLLSQPHHSSQNETDARFTPTPGTSADVRDVPSNSSMLRCLTHDIKGVGQGDCGTWDAFGRQVKTYFPGLSVASSGQPAPNFSRRFLWVYHRLAQEIRV